VGGFVFEFECVFADELAALVVAGACQRFEVEAASGHRQHTHARRIQQQDRVGRNPACGHDPAQAKVALVGRHAVAVGRLAGRITPHRTEEAVDLSLLKTADDDRIDAAVAVFPDLPQDVVDLVLVERRTRRHAAGVRGKHIRRQMRENALHRPADRAAALGGGARCAAVDDGVFQVPQQFTQPFLFLVIHLIGQSQLRRRQVRAADLDRGGKDLRVVAHPAAIGKPCFGLIAAFQCGVAEDVDLLAVADLLGGGACIENMERPALRL